VRVAECTSVPHSAPTSTPGGGGGGGGSGEICCPPGDVPYVIEYNFTVNSGSYNGVTSEWYWSGSQFTVSATHDDSSCNPPYLSILFTLSCLANVGIGGQVNFVCGYTTICSLSTPGDIDVVVTGCPNLPTFYFTIKPGRCASGSFVVRPS
jgi:hypothetical protein